MKKKRKKNPANQNKNKSLPKNEQRSLMNIRALAFYVYECLPMSVCASCHTVSMVV